MKIRTFLTFGHDAFTLKQAKFEKHIESENAKIRYYMGELYNWDQSQKSKGKVTNHDGPKRINPGNRLKTSSSRKFNG